MGQTYTELNANKRNKTKLEIFYACCKLGLFFTYSMYLSRMVGLRLVVWYCPRLLEPNKKYEKETFEHKNMKKHENT